MKSILFALILGAHILNISPIVVNAPGTIDASENIPICAINYEENTPECVANVISLAADCNLPNYLTRDYPMPTNEKLSAKTYMSYQAITSKSSLQYQYIHSDEIILDDRGFLMSSDGQGFYGVALGSYFGDIGSRYIFTLQRPDGSTHELKVVKVEAKSDKHTCEHNYKAGSNDVIEFVIDTKADYMRENVWGNGLIFQGNFNNCEDFRGNIIGIREVVDDEIL